MYVSCIFIAHVFAKINELVSAALSSINLTLLVNAKEFTEFKGFASSRTYFYNNKDEENSNKTTFM